MKRITKFIVAFIAVLNISALSAEAFEWKYKAGDKQLSGTQVKKMVFGKRLKHSDGGVEHYLKTNRYQYTDPKGKKYPALKYKFNRDGSRCMFFGGGSQRCDMYVSNKGNLVLINIKGTRFKATVMK